MYRDLGRRSGGDFGHLCDWLVWGCGCDSDEEVGIVFWGVWVRVSPARGMYCPGWTSSWVPTVKFRTLVRSFSMSVRALSTWLLEGMMDGYDSEGQ